jgi:hypothetical protein
VLGLRLQIGDAGDVGAVAGLELHRQLLLDVRIGDVVDRHLDVGIVLHEAVHEVGQHVALDAVGVPHDAHVAGERRRARKQRRGKRGQG